jgi:hypothetical protein
MTDPREPYDIIRLALSMIATGLNSYTYPDSRFLKGFMHLCFFVGTTTFFLVGIRELLDESGRDVSI